MVRYRRKRLPGATYFFTLTLKDRRPTVLINRIDLLRVAMKRVQTACPYKVHAIVILPDHLHAIWKLPEGDSDYSLRWRLIKRYFTKSVIDSGLEFKKNRRSEYDLW